MGAGQARPQVKEPSQVADAQTQVTYLSPDADDKMQSPTKPDPPAPAASTESSPDEQQGPPPSGSRKLNFSSSTKAWDASTAAQPAEPQVDQRENSTAIRPFESRTCSLAGAAGTSNTTVDEPVTLAAPLQTAWSGEEVVPAALSPSRQCKPRPVSVHSINDKDFEEFEDLGGGTVEDTSGFEPEGMSAAPDSRHKIIETFQQHVEVV